MSIQTQIAALQLDKINIAEVIEAKGGTVAAGDGFDDFAADIATIPEGSGKGGEYHIISTSNLDGTQNLAITDATVFTLQEKSATYTQNGSAVVSADEGYDGLSSVAISISVPEYQGEYVVTPTVVGFTMLTENKVMTDDVTVNAIPYYATENPQGGKTIYIGSTLDD